MKSIFVLLVAVALVQASVNLIANGGFESNSCGSDTWCTYYGPSVFAPSWTVDFGSIDVQHSCTCQWAAYEGTFTVDLSGNGEGAIYQDVATNVGDSYTLSWEQAGNLWCDPPVKYMHVQVTGSDTQYYSFDTTGYTPTNMGWESESFSFTATSGVTRVEFVSDIYSSCGVVIDTVSLIDTTPLTPQQQCAATDQSTWNQYGQGYFCSNADQGFVQCWGSVGSIYGVYQNCPTGTTCQCADGVECSDNGTSSPCA